MLQAVLLDLDDTLLGNSMDTFMPRYFSLLGQYAEQLFDREQFLREWLICTQGVIHNTDSTLSNRDVFWTLFRERSGFDPVALEPFFEPFYRNEFRQLQVATERRPIAADFIRSCFEQKLQVVIATNPLFPRVAIEERLAWAGVPVTEFDYDLVTTYENMHFTKPHPAYYREILEMIDCPPTAALMVGDDWKNDVVPAAEVGLFTYWIAPEEATPPDETVVTGYGSLAQLHEQLQAGWWRRPGKMYPNGRE